VQPNFAPAPEYIPLPPRFAGRFRFGVIMVGASLILGTLFFAIGTAFFNLVLHNRAFPMTLLGRIADLLVVVSVIATGITVITARRCLRGDYLVLARARSTHAALTTCFAATMATSILAVLVHLVVDVWGGPPSRFLDVLSPLVYLVFGALGFAVGHFYVRPTAETLRRFSDFPIW
jgi:hypothetical protein